MNLIQATIWSAVRRARVSNEERLGQTKEAYAERRGILGHRQITTVLRRKLEENQS